ncbi:MAG: hypothetical protein LBR33_06255 [Propionibacteriaceae bacterium]|jgi:hypothetical protein|nr:hypothetical protein [Propionibacteriaceae bacterium]
MTDDGRARRAWGEPVTAAPEPVLPVAEPAAPEASVVAAAPAPIATIPPLPSPAETGYPLSARTGRPRRPALLVTAEVLFWSAPVALTVAFARFWWDAASVDRLWESSRLFGWAKPDPVSALAIVLVLVTAAILVVVVGAVTAVAVNAWAGRRWTRWGGLAAVAVGALTLLLNAWAPYALAPVLLGTVLLWFPPFGRFCAAMTPAPKNPGRLPVDVTPVTYGPMRLLGN